MRGRLADLGCAASLLAGFVFNLLGLSWPQRCLRVLCIAAGNIDVDADGGDPTRHPQHHGRACEGAAPSVWMGCELGTTHVGLVV